MICPHCSKPIYDCQIGKMDHQENCIDCPKCGDIMFWEPHLENVGYYECNNCGERDIETKPIECGECGITWPFKTN